MKAILYNYFGSQSSVIIMPLLSALFISIKTIDMVIVMPLMLLSFGQGIIEKDKSIGWDKRVKTLPINRRDIYLSRTITFIIFGLILIGFTIFLNILLFGINLTSRIGYTGLSYHEMIIKFIGIFSFSFVIYSLDLLFNFTIFKEKEKMFKFSLVLYYMIFVLYIILEITNILSFNIFLHLSTIKINDTASVIALIGAITFNLIVNKIIIDYETTKF